MQTIILNGMKRNCNANYHSKWDEGVIVMQTIILNGMKRNCNANYHSKWDEA